MGNILFWIQGPIVYDILSANLFKLSKIKDIDFKIVVCTNDKIDRIIFGVEVIQIEDPGPDKNEFITLNYSRQYSTTRPILNYLDQNSNFDLVIKIRSDIEITSQKKFYRLIQKYPLNQILVSSYNTMHLDNIFEYYWQVSDWLYVTTPNLIKELINPIDESHEVLKNDKNKYFLKHWVGVKTCEQAMISNAFALSNDFYVKIKPVNIYRHGLYLTKYRFLYRPKTYAEFKAYIYSHLSTYTELEFEILMKSKLLFNVIKNTKSLILKWLLKK